MILPTTYATALLLAVLSMICWGSWANTFKLTKKWRFELFYFDYAGGVLLFALIAMFTFGVFGEPPSAYENLAYFAGKRQLAYGVLAGVVFNLANMLLVAAISLSGMAVAFPIGIGLALVIGVILNYTVNQQGNPILLFTGTALVVAAIIVDALAYRAHEANERQAKRTEQPAPAAQSAQVRAQPASTAVRKGTGPVRSAPAHTAPAPASTSIKGIVISLIAGVLMGCFYPIVELSTASDIGLRAYSVMFMFAIGVFLSTFVFNMYFMNLPVQGEPVGFGAYFRGSPRYHLLGLLGGALWCAGALANFCAAAAPKEVNVGPAISYALGQGATLVSVLWGLFVWREFRGATSRVRTLLGVMILLFVVGLGLVSVAPLYK
jgi:glucose uptake protein